MRGVCRNFHALALLRGEVSCNLKELVAVCLLTRFVVAVPLHNPNQEDVARALVTHDYSQLLEMILTQIPDFGSTRTNKTPSTP